MAGLHLYAGNRLENLKKQLAVRLRDNPLPPLGQELIVVQSAGMQKWLSLQLADEHNIFANVAYLFPKALVQSVFKSALDAGAISFFSPEVLTWSVMKVLPGLLDRRGFESLNHYLRNDASGLDLFQLAQQIAEMLARYFVLRPDVILTWSRGANPMAGEAGSRWQFILWREILENCPPQARGMDPAVLKHRLMSSPDILPGLPQRLSVFGISTLAPYYVDILVRLAAQVDMDVYYMNPCRQYWEYVFSQKEMARFTVEGVPEDAAYMDEGNSLLASQGNAGREFFSLLLTRVGDTGEDLFVDPGQADMLTTVQSDVLNLLDIRSESPLPVLPQDKSIQVHACYSPIREVEALYDTLLAVFEGDDDVQPKDVVVMMPDVSAYAPLIQAVFDTPENPSRRIAYSIADITVKQANIVAGALLTILSMNRNRYRASDVLDLLDIPPVRLRFGLDEHQLDRIKDWVKGAGIRWGIDSRYRTGLGLPDFPENTWAFGLDRMLLGHALSPLSGEKMFAGILPYGQFEEDNSRILGQFVSFVQSLFTCCRSLESPKTILEWGAVLNNILADFFLADNEATENDIAEIRRVLLDGGLSDIYEITGFEDTVSLDIIRDYLEGRLAGSPRSSGFISNGVTFCTLLPMRSIPFKVVCMLGMNDGDFPRVSHRLRFDLLEARRRPCDFSKTFEDRYLFLESILSARKSLIISYIGQDIGDNSQLPPSSVVCELLEYLARRFTTGAGTDVMAQVVTRHPLQPFSPGYFTDSGKLFSYSEENYTAALRNLENKDMPRRLFDRPLPEPAEESWRPLMLDSLTAFFKNPAAFVIKNRLNMDLAVADRDRPDDREPFSLDNLQQYLIRQDLVQSFASQGKLDGETAFEVMKAAGRLPHGSLGEIAWAACDREASQFLKAVSPYLEGGAADPENIECRLTDARQTIIVGVVDRLYIQGQIFYRGAKVKAMDILAAWIYHLALNTTEVPGVVRTTRLFGLDRQIELSEMTGREAVMRLGELTDLFFQGMTEPLRFSPESAYALAEKIAAGKSMDAARSAAVRRWRGGRDLPGEGEDLHISRCFDESVLDDERFGQTALAVFGPVFDHIKN